MGNKTQWVVTRKSNSASQLFHSGTKGMKWGYNDGRPNGKRKAAEYAKEMQDTDGEINSLNSEIDELKKKEKILEKEYQTLNDGYAELPNDLYWLNEQIKVYQIQDKQDFNGTKINGKSVNSPVSKETQELLRRRDLIEKSIKYYKTKMSEVAAKQKPISDAILDKELKIVELQKKNLDTQTKMLNADPRMNRKPK